MIGLVQMVLEKKFMVMYLKRDLMEILESKNTAYNNVYSSLRLYSTQPNSSQFTIFGYGRKYSRIFSATSHTQTRCNTFDEKTANHLISDYYSHFL